MGSSQVASLKHSSCRCTYRRGFGRWRCKATTTATAELNNATTTSTSASPASYICSEPQQPTSTQQHATPPVGPRGTAGVWRTRGLPMPTPAVAPAAPPDVPCPVDPTTLTHLSPSSSSADLKLGTASSAGFAGLSASDPRTSTPPPAVALALAATALLFLPLLHLLRHGELAAHGITASLAAVTWATVTVFQSLGGAAALEKKRTRAARAARSNAAWPHGNTATGIVLPLPVELSLQPAAVVTAVLPLLVALAAAIIAAFSGHVAAVDVDAAAAAAASGGGGGLRGSGMHAAAVRRASDAASLQASAEAAWLRVGLLYTLALLVPSPGPPRAVRPSPSTSAFPRGRRLRRVAGHVLGQGARLLLLWWAWLSLPTAPGGAWTAGVWACVVGAFWALHTAGVVASAAAGN